MKSALYSSRKRKWRRLIERLVRGFFAAPFPLVGSLVWWAQTHPSFPFTRMKRG